MLPTWECDRVKLFLGDCRTILPTIEADAALVSDPPYGMNNDNDYGRFTGGPNSHGEAASRTYQPTIGDDKPFDPSPCLDFDEVILWGANHFSARLPVGTTLVWLKRFDGGFGSFLSDAEVGWMKGGCGVYCHRDTSMYSSPEKRVHPNEKPVGLMKWCIGKTTNETVIDPYMGSGSTIVAALRAGRRAIGIEIDPHYFEVAKRRIQDELTRTPLFDNAPEIQPELFNG